MMLNLTTSLRQKGSSLVFSLVVLTAITLGAMVAMQRSTLQLRMIGNQQQQQQVFQAAFSNIERVYANLLSTATANTVLSYLLTKDKEYQNSGHAEGDYQMTVYDVFKWAEPNYSKGVSVTNNVRVLQSNDSTSAYDLKRSPGSSTGTEVPYYFATNAAGASGNGNITSNQELAFYYLAPAPNAN